MILLHALARKPRWIRLVLRTLIASGLAISALKTTAADIYQWRDADGRIQFGDKPPVAGAKPLEIRHAPAPSVPAETAAARQARTERLLNEYATERSEREAERAEENAARVERMQRCAEARDRLYDVEDAGYLYARDATGEKTVLPDLELRLEQERARAVVKHICAGDAGNVPRRAVK